MSEQVELNESGNEVTVFYDFTMCGDFPECHSGECNCADVEGGTE